MKRPLIVFLLLLATTTAAPLFGQGGAQRGPVIVATSPAEREEWQRIQQRFKEHWPRMSGWSWTLIHSYASKTELESALRLFEAIALALANNDPATVRKFNDSQGYKERLITLMGSTDQTVSGFAASILAVIGDMNYAPQIAALLDHSTSVAGREITVRGQAAEALGLLNAKQYAPRIALLLRSEEFYDRAGAAFALGHLKATEYANEVAHLLLDATGLSSVDGSPIYSLFEMGVAANYKKEFAQVLGNDFFNDRAVVAAYALARLGATEHSKAVAKFLKSDVRKGEAAKALALLGAKEYIAEIALLLEDRDSFNREDGAIALGMLGARDHIPAIAKLLKDEKLWVQLSAAFALVLLEANEYAKSVVRVVAQQKSGAYLSSEDFIPLVAEQAADLEQRLRVLLKKMKASQPARAAKSPARRRR
jgi:HEAT repeat protein